jgi:hypothetical protein
LNLNPPLPGHHPHQDGQQESSGLFLAFDLLAFHKKLDKDFFVFVQLKPHAFGMALLVAASPPVRKRRG